MAGPETLRFGKFLVELEDSPGAGTYSAPCGFLERSLRLSADVAQRALPNRETPSQPGWVARDVVGLSASVNGTGILAMEDAARWRTAFVDAKSIRIRVRFEHDHGGYWQGLAILANWEIRGAKGSKATQAVQLDSDRAWTWSAVVSGADGRARLALDDPSQTAFLTLLGIY